MDFLIFREPVNAWTHCSWLLLSLPGTWLLWRLSRGDRAKQLSLLIFGFSLAVCYGGSTLYHGVQLDYQYIRIFQTLDYIGIYLLIAGSYTPASFTLLRGRWKWGSLALVWLLASGGIIIRAVSFPLPDTVSTGLYLVLGWGSVFFYFEMARTLSHRALFPVVLGGVLYSLGAILNLLRWPILCFTAHEFMHLCVMGGSLSHYWFMLNSVVPFERKSATPVSSDPQDENGDAFDDSLVPVQTGSLAT
jgi:hemolysin III